MDFRFAHNNLNVLDLRRSLAFYKKALGLGPVRRIVGPKKSFVIVYLGDGSSKHQLELTWLAGRRKRYDLGENEFHLAFVTDDFEAAKAKHRKLGCICHENPAMGIYFIEDPDGYWLEVLPRRHRPPRLDR